MSACLATKSLLGQLADDVPDENVHLLNARRYRAGHLDAEIAHAGEGAATIARPADDLDPHFPSLLNRTKDVRARTASGNGDEDILGVTVRFNLTGVDHIEAVVVSDCRHDRGVGVQGQSWKSAPFHKEAAYEFTSYVLGIGGAAAISAKHDFPALSQALGHQFGGTQDLWGDRLSGFNRGLVITEDPSDFGKI